MKPLEIKGARVRLGYTQQYVAECLGISVNSYQKKESGRVRFTDPEKCIIIKLFHLTIEQVNDYLFDGGLPIGNAGNTLGKPSELAKG